MRGKLIVIEGCDCSGKKTQSLYLKKALEQRNIPVSYYSFPNYDTPTGKIVGGPFLGKEEICQGYFKELAPNVPYQVASLYYAADRFYNIAAINEDLNCGKNVILNRYVYSNIAHQGGKEKTKQERLEAYQFIAKLEFELLKLPQADIKIFLDVPIKLIKKLKKQRSVKESLDENEQDDNYLKRSVEAYYEVVSLYDFYKIACSFQEILKSKQEINQEIMKYVMEKLK